MSDRQRGTALQYLLGELPEPEAIQFEEQYFADDELFEEISALENDLVDSYVLGELSEAERQQFERGYLISPARQANVEFSRALAEYLSTLQPKKFTSSEKSAPGFFAFQSGLGRLAWAAVAFIAIATLSWTVMVNRQLHHELDSMRAQQTEFQGHVQDLMQQISSLNSRLHEMNSTVVQPGLAVISIALVPGTSRSPDASPKLVIAPVAPQIQLKLFMEHDDYPSYRVSVETAVGQQIWQKDGLKSLKGPQGSRAVMATLPSSLLKGNDYLVRLDGQSADGKFEEAEDYRFQVVRR